jgi:hypothetical protein
VKKPLGLIVFAATIASSAIVYAEPARFGQGAMGTLPAARFLSSGGVVQVPVNHPLTITLANKAMVRKLADAGFQIRLFKLGPDGKPQEVQPGFPPCHIYITSRWEGVQRDDLSLYFGALGPNWLSPAADGRLTPGRWMLVFEDNRDDHDVLRLNDQDVGTYFAAALTLIVDPGPLRLTVRDLTPTTPEEARYQEDLRQEAKANTNDRLCMRVRELVQVDTFQVARLESCQAAEANSTGSSLQ